MFLNLKSVIVGLVFICCTAAGGFSQELQLIHSRFLKKQDSVLVFKPSSYNGDHRYPAVYLLHGHSASHRAWPRLANLQQLADRHGFIIICPDGLRNSWYINSPKRDSSQFESFFTGELMVEMSRRYSIHSKQVFVTGASMGGHGALWLFIRHPNLFRSAGSTSGVVNLRHSGFKKTTLASHLGAYSEDNEAFDRFSIIHNISKLTGSDKTFIFDCGTEDYLYKANKSLRDKCDEFKIKATYIAQPGAHTGGYWSGTLLQHMEFFARQIQK